jgi:hypothetical protein
VVGGIGDVAVRIRERVGLRLQRIGTPRDRRDLEPLAAEAARDGGGNSGAHAHNGDQWHHNTPAKKIKDAPLDPSAIGGEAPARRHEPAAFGGLRSQGKKQCRFMAGRG